MIECLKTRRGEREVCLAVFLRGFHDGIIVTGGVDFAGGSGGESGGRHDLASDIQALIISVETWGQMLSVGM